MADPRGPDFPSLLGGIAKGLRIRDLPFMLIGGQAVLLHGRPRLTEDIDVTLGADVSRLPDVLAVCALLGLSPLPEDPARFAEETSVLPARDAATGVRVDFVFSTTAYERQAIDRAVSVVLGDVSIPFASAEDLIVHKLFAGRARDWEDAVSVVRRRGNELDWDYLERWVREFSTVPGREDLPERLAALRQDRPAS